MDFKKILVSFLTIASLVLLVATVSAAPSLGTVTVGDGKITAVQVNGVDIMTGTSIAGTSATVNAGDTVQVKVFFTGDTIVDYSNVRVKAIVEGATQDVEARSGYFDTVHTTLGNQYVETFTLKVPAIDSSETSANLPLSIEVWNSDFSIETSGLQLHVQSPSYDASIVSINVDNTIKAGQVVPVEVVLKNTGYNDLSSMTVTAKIATLGIQKSAFFGDLINVEHPSPTDSEVTTVSGKLYLTLPIDAPAGTYALEVTASNEQTSSTVTQQVTVQNDYPQTVLQTATGLLIVNPTNNVQVYKVVLPTKVEQLVTVQAGASQTVDVKATADDYAVSVTNLNGQVLGTFKFNAVQEQTVLTKSPIVVLTVILGIVFLVLLVVLVVLISRKPQKSQELGESYY